MQGATLVVYYAILFARYITIDHGGKDPDENHQEPDQLCRHQRHVTGSPVIRFLSSDGFEITKERKPWEPPILMFTAMRDRMD